MSTVIGVLGQPLHSLESTSCKGARGREFASSVAFEQWRVWIACRPNTPLRKVPRATELDASEAG